MPEEKKRSVQITQNRMRLAEFDRQEWVANAEFGTTVDDIQEPGYWAHMAAQLKPYDHIEVRAEDGTWIAHLVVMGCDRTWAKVVVDRVMTLTTKDVAMSQASKYEIAWKGPQHRHAVIRSADREMVKSGFQTREEAGLWMREYEKVTG